MTTVRTVDVTPADTTGMKKLIYAVNLAKNPRGVNSTGIVVGFGTGGAGGVTYPTTGGPLTDAPTFVRNTLTTAPTSGSITIILGAVGTTDIDPADIGSQMRFAVYARASRAATGVSQSAGWYGASGFLSGAAGASDSLVANTWKALPAITATVPANTTRFQLQVTFPVASIPGLAAGDTLDATAFLIHKPVTGYDGSYFDGSSPIGSAWQGTAHASRSTKIVGIG